MTSSLHYAEEQFQDALKGPLDPKIAVYLEKAQKAGNRKQFGYDRGFLDAQRVLLRGHRELAVCSCYDAPQHNLTLLRNS